MFSILEIDDPEWTLRLESLPPHKRDVHFYPHILAPYVTVYGWAAKAALTVEDDNFVLQPFVMTHDGQIRHAYNFGGYAVHGDSFIIQRHQYLLRKWGLEHGANSEFITFNPFMIPGPDAEKVKDSVYIDLTNLKFRGTTRRLANKAQGLGAKITTVPPTSENVKVFNRIYTNTMDRAQAKEYWYTPPKFFEELLAWTNGFLMLLEHKGEVEAGCVIIPSYANKVAYYHYAGSYNRYPKDGINHLMVLAAAEHAKAIGCDKLFLGGGLTADPKDGLFVFKSGFSDLRAPVYVYKRLYS